MTILMVFFGRLRSCIEVIDGFVIWTILGHLSRGMLGLGYSDHGRFFVLCCLFILVLLITVWFFGGQVNFLLNGVDVRVWVVLFLGHKRAIVVFVRIWVIHFTDSVSIKPALHACSSNSSFLHIIYSIGYKRSYRLTVLAIFFLDCLLHVTVATLCILRPMLYLFPVTSLTIPLQFCSILVAACRGHRIVLRRMCITAGRMKLAFAGSLWSIAYRPVKSCSILLNYQINFLLPCLFM